VQSLCWESRKNIQIIGMQARTIIVTGEMLARCLQQQY
jgi:hypothetical protein